MPAPWDYLILTASNEPQAQAYESQLGARVAAGRLPEVRAALVEADPGGRRIGSGGSTLRCLARVVGRERRSPGESAAAVLARLRVLIVHAGGDSRRLPAYAPCGKIFVPMPVESRGPLPATLFDLLAPQFLKLPPGAEGQVVVAAGDALNRMETGPLSLAEPGLIALGAHTSPEEAARHGVFCLGEGGVVRLYLQKPALAEQIAHGAITPGGAAVLDIGVMSFDAASSAALLAAFEPFGAEIAEHGLDLYREICCAMGSQATPEHYLRSARASGSRWSEPALRAVYPLLRAIPLRARLVPQASFLHFGSTRQLIESGAELAGTGRLSVNNEIRGAGTIRGGDFWVEGCRISAPLELEGRNVVAGVDIDEPLSLPRGACLEVLKGRTREGSPAWFVRCYGIDDTFKDDRFRGRPMPAWFGAGPLWDARVFPAVPDPGAYRDWLWMLEPECATAEQKAAFLAAARYSAAEIAWLADQDAFYRRRADNASRL